MRALIASVLVMSACGSDAGPGGPFDSGLAPRDELTNCELGSHQDDPSGECLAQWGCPGYGSLQLACGAAGDAGLVCICIHDEEPPVRVNMTPTSCSVTAMTDFARLYCGWSLP